MALAARRQPGRGEAGGLGARRLDGCKRAAGGSHRIAGRLRRATLFPRRPGCAARAAAPGSWAGRGAGTAAFRGSRAAALGGRARRPGRRKQRHRGRSSGLHQRPAAGRRGRPYGHHGARTLLRSPRARRRSGRCRCDASRGPRGLARAQSERCVGLELRTGCGRRSLYREPGPGRQQSVPGRSGPGSSGRADRGHQRPRRPERVAACSGHAPRAARERPRRGRPSASRAGLDRRAARGRRHRTPPCRACPQCERAAGSAPTARRAGAGLRVWRYPGRQRHPARRRDPASQTASRPGPGAWAHRGLRLGRHHRAGAASPRECRNGPGLCRRFRRRHRCAGRGPGDRVAVAAWRHAGDDWSPCSRPPWLRACSTSVGWRSSSSTSEVPADPPW